MNGEVYEKIEKFASEQLQTPFILPDKFKNQIRSVASKIRNKYQQSSYKEERFLKDQAVWLQVLQIISNKSDFLSTFKNIYKSSYFSFLEAH